MSNNFAEYLEKMQRVWNEINPGPNKSTMITINEAAGVIEITLNPNEEQYSDWIAGEGADIYLERSIATDKVVGARLPLTYDNIQFIYNKREDE